MPEISIFICDWCGEKYDDQELPPTAKGWTLNLQAETLIRQGSSRHVEPIYLFPPVMRQVADGKNPSHFECILCPGCITALQDAAKNVREIQISKRKE